VEAWALHQLGTRAAGLGFDEQARGLLMEALKIRRAIGDRAGLAVTQHNLLVFFNIPQSSKAGQFRSRRCLTCGAIGAGLFVIASIVVAGLFILLSNQTPLLPLPETSSATETLISTNLPLGTVPLPRTEIPAATFTPTQMPTPTILFDFVLDANKAIWESSETFDPDDSVFEDCDLTFGATPLPSCGFARWESTALEDNSALQNVLVVEPYHTNGGQIWGTYDLTHQTITEGTRLVTVVGFLKTAETLGVAFQVSFTTGDPDFSPVLVYATRDRNDGRLIAAITPLPDELIGQSGFFILQVLAAPNTNANWASWAVARLEQP